VSVGSALVGWAACGYLVESGFTSRRPILSHTPRRGPVPVKRDACACSPVTSMLVQQVQLASPVLAHGARCVRPRQVRPCSTSRSAPCALSAASVSASSRLLSARLKWPPRFSTCRLHPTPRPTPTRAPCRRPGRRSARERGARPRRGGRARIGKERRAVICGVSRASTVALAWPSYCGCCGAAVRRHSRALQRRGGRRGGRAR
jgi:hypothetical protein